MTHSHCGQDGLCQTVILPCSHVIGLSSNTIKNVFLHGDLEEEVHMEEPPGFVAQGEASTMICRLCRPLYGLKQSPRAWFDKFCTVVQQFGSVRSDDHSIFYLHSPQGCIYLVYADDIAITGGDQHGIAQLKQYLSRQFQTKDLGKLWVFLRHRSCSVQGWCSDVSEEVCS